MRLTLGTMTALGMPFLRTSPYLLGGVFAVLFALAPLSPSLLRADAPAAEEAKDDEMARRLFETGRAYYERARYDEAAEAFGEAYALSGRSALLLNQARALEGGGRHAEAAQVLERFLEAGEHDEASRASVESMLRRLRASAERQGGEAAPVEPEPLTLEEDEGPLAAEAAPRSKTKKALGFGALSLGGASLAVALGTGIAARSSHDSLEEACPMSRCAPEREGEIDRGHRLAVTSTVFTFIGVAAAAAGVLTLVLGKDDEGRDRVALTPGPTGAGAGLLLRF